MTNETAQHPSSQNRPPRILFIAEAVALSHVVRPFVLARHLQRRGYDVCLARDPRYSHLFAESDLRVIDLYSLAGSLVETRLARHEPVHDTDTLNRYVQDDLRLLREFKPDVVVGDFRHSLAISAQLMRIPYVNIAEGHWSSSVDTQYELPNSPLSGLIGMPLSNFLFQAFQPLAFAYQTLPLNLIRLKYGLPIIGPDIKAWYTYGDYTVYPNDPNLFPLKKPLPTRHTFIGPIPWSPSVEKPEWWDQLPQDRPIVYVSLGSTGKAGLLHAVLGILEKLPVTVMLATADRWKSNINAQNIFMADFLPGTQAAARSRLVICNGGTMSGQQALSAGTPYLGLISNMDQMLFSMAVRRASGCELLREGDVNENSLRPLILSILSQEKYQFAAKGLAARAANLDSCKKFEEILCSVMKDRFVRHSEHEAEAVQL